ncbi:hypothetical protein [uncultured Sphingomonas sp.]|uniref:hypothetical protein n=1 Tax=uncultured Sphingomonas sp. TaxID=158754 RepID=UPI00263A3AAC|nr:hypothetical protein [uncultured Sphingomonas sp.]
MKKLPVIAAGIAIACAAAPVVAARWVPIAERSANLDARISQGLHSGSLNRAQGVRLRSEVRHLKARETRYRRGGLTLAERRDLDQRFARLSAEIRFEKHGGHRR